MNKFLGKSMLLIFIFLICIIAFFFAIDSIGWSDASYKRFTTKGHKSLIIGTSRSAQGIVPRVINEDLSDTCFQLPIYNFSFNIIESPFGEVYFNAISKKIGVNEKKNSLFIVCVDPYALSDTEAELREGKRREYGGRLDKVHTFRKPQLNYLFRYCRPRSWKNMHYEELHNDGWLQINAEMDSVSVAERFTQKMKDYNEISIYPSTYRLHWLMQTISILKSNGTIFLIRMPMSPEIKQWEDRQWPDFNKDMKQLSEKYNIQYLDFTLLNNMFRTTDGNHLFKDDAFVFTDTLCDSITVISNAI